MKKKNPLISKSSKIESYTSFEAVKKENVVLAKLPDDPSGVVVWEPNTYQVWLFDDPKNTDIKNVSPFLPRSLTLGRIIPFGTRTPFERFFNSANKSILASVQFIEHHDSVEVLFMSTKRGWQKLHLMKVLINFIKSEFEKPITYWEPTEAGKKFIAKQKNPIKNKAEFDKFFAPVIELTSLFRDEKIERINEFYNSILALNLRADQVTIVCHLRRFFHLLSIFRRFITERRHDSLHLKKTLQLLGNDAQKIFSSDLSRLFKKQFYVNKSIELAAGKSALSKFAEENFISKVVEPYDDICNNLYEDVYHFIRLISQNPERYKSLLKINWNRNASELVRLLKAEEERIHEKYAGISVLTAKEKAKPTEIFLKISPTLKWEIIYDSYCPFEAEAMGHCATAKEDCYLLSLRLYTSFWIRWDKDKQKFVAKELKQKEWLPQVTATLCPDEENKGKYIVSEILGPKNTQIRSDWYDAVIALLLDKRISGATRYQTEDENRFSVERLSNKQQDYLFKRKPVLAPFSYSLKKMNFNQIRKVYFEFIKVIEAKDQVYLKKDFKQVGSVYQIFEAASFYDLLEKLKVLSSRDVRKQTDRIIDLIDNWIPEYLDIDATEYIDDLYSSLSSSQKYKLNNVVGLKLERLSEKEKWSAIKNLDVADNFHQAIQEGFSFDSSVEMYKAFQSAFDGLCFLTEANTPSICLNKNDSGTWSALINKEDFFENLIGAEFSGELYLDSLLYETEHSRYRGRDYFGEVTWEYGFDLDAAISRFKEEIDQYLE